MVQVLQGLDAKTWKYICYQGKDLFYLYLPWLNLLVEIWNLINYHNTG